NSDNSKAVLFATENADYFVLSVKKQVKSRRPLPPFTTSTLQQDANKKLSLQSQRTMKIAQELYEGVHVGEKGLHGLITYMRTDSVRISDEAREAARIFITEKYGENYYPQTPNIYKTKQGAQDAHEAVRPTDPNMTPDLVREKLNNEQYKLYKLIWERYIASQMKSAEFDTVSADISADKYIFRANGNSLKFQGFLAVYGEIDDDSSDGESTKLPELLANEKLLKTKLIPEQHFTQPPAKFTEGSLVKMLEEKGIGRPSTYAPTITTIITRGYIQRSGKILDPTELGRITTNVMKSGFPKIVDYDFTANMEAELDLIEGGEREYHGVLSEFYSDFEKQLQFADAELEKVDYKKPVEYTDIICEKCGATMVIKEGRYGKFAACPNYPTCKNTKKLAADGKNADVVSPEQEILSDEKCPVCGKEMILKKGAFGTFFACRDYPDCKTTRPFFKDTGILCPKCGKRLVTKQSRKKRTFYSCEDYPNCKFSCWDVPTEDKCPSCGAVVLKKKYKNTMYCSLNCGWSSDGSQIKNEGADSEN
ncbi:MAG: type I DNA topoisomerase, partial [Clostridia bacterium]